MQNKIYSNISSAVLLNSFILFPEYLISVSILYALIVMVLITYNVYGLMIQKALSQCIALMLFMACYLMINDDLIALEIINSYSFNHSIIHDYFGFFTRFVVCFSSGVYFMLIADSLKGQHLTSFEYLLITLFSVLGLMLLCISNDLLTAYLAIELTSLTSYVLASSRRTLSYSVESGLKYFIVGAISSAFFLLGSSFIYGASGSINFTVFSLLFEFTDRFSLFTYLTNAIDDAVKLNFLFDHNFAVEIGLALICFSLFVKLAAAPFHVWSLDVFEGSPTSASFFFAVISKLSIFVLLVRLCIQSFHTYSDSWQFYFFLVGLFSIFVGCLGGLKQTKVKTLLAYSSTSHMGYFLVAFSAGTPFAIQMMLFSLVIYILAGLCTWSIILFLRLKKKDFSDKYNKELGDFTLLKKSNPSLAFALALTMFSVAGIPPLVGFIAKMSLFLPVLNLSNHSLYIVVVLISFLISVISTFYYIRIIKTLYFENALVGRLYYPINTNQTLTLSILVLLLLFIFVNPTLLYLLTYKAKLSLS